MPERECGTEDEIYDVMIAKSKDARHPERYVLGKRHLDRAKQFKSFAALRGYEELIEEVMAKAAEPHDFSEAEDPC